MCIVQSFVHNFHEFFIFEISFVLAAKVWFISLDLPRLWEKVWNLIGKYRKTNISFHLGILATASTSFCRRQILSPFYRWSIKVSNTGHVCLWQVGLHQSEKFLDSIGEKQKDFSNRQFVTVQRFIDLYLPQIVP